MPNFWPNCWCVEVESCEDTYFREHPGRFAGAVAETSNWWRRYHADWGRPRIDRRGEFPGGIRCDFVARTVRGFGDAFVTFRFCKRIYLKSVAAAVHLRRGVARRVGWVDLICDRAFDLDAIDFGIALGLRKCISRVRALIL